MQIKFSEFTGGHRIALSIAHNVIHFSLMDRRAFLLTGTGLVMSAHAQPSDRITLGVIGSGGRGTAVMGVFQKHSDVRVGAICDVYEPNLGTSALASHQRRLASQGLPKLQRPSR